MGTWPVNTGHPCFGCSEEGVGFNIPLHTPANVKNITPAAGLTPINVDHGGGMSTGAVALAAVVAGAALGAGAVAVKKVGQEEKKQD
jgi:hydrogenase small subunit